jgi:signal transduction histidine kinase
MNRLWVRLSIAFAAVVLVVMLILSIMIRQSGHELVTDIEVPAEVRAYFQEFRPQRLPWLDLTTVLALVGMVAIIAGAWVSRTLTAPLRKLEQAAEAIGRQDLSRRVSVRGSEEIRAVAHRFNVMAGQLEQAETLRRSLLADVAHELRNPMHVLRGNLRAILDDVYPLDKEEIARLLDQTHHLTKLLDDLHELAQAEAHQLPLTKKETDMATLVKETAVPFRLLAAMRQIELRVELLGKIPTLAVDAARVRQAVHNLIGNALHHTPDGGQVLVQVVQEADKLHILVCDSGTGIAPDQLPHVFDRFYRTDSARSRDKGGAGLGLAIVKAITEAHDGRATAVSKGVGQGSEFRISLPL